MPYLTPEKKTAKELLKKDIKYSYDWVTKEKKVVQRRTGRG